MIILSNITLSNRIIKYQENINTHLLTSKIASLQIMYNIKIELEHNLIYIEGEEGNIIKCLLYIRKNNPKVFENNIIEQLTFENKLYITDYIKAYKPSWYSYSYVES